jgi:hypothetical protein
MTEVILYAAFAVAAVVLLVVLGVRWFIVRQQRQVFAEWDRTHGVQAPEAESKE